MQRWIAHIDMDCFYVAVERLKNPQLIGKPIVVGGRGPRAVISSASYEVRPFGVRSAMPVGQARRLFRDLIVVEPHFEWYSEISGAIFEALKNTAPKVEQVSIDEAYLDFTGCDRLYESREASAKKIKDVVKEVSGLNCTVCVATNKLVAKIGSDLAKPNGLLVVKPGTEAQMLAALPIKKIPGMGAKTSIYFDRKGIKTCGELARIEDDVLLRSFGNYALDFKEAAQGLDDSEVEVDGERKSLGSEETFDFDENSWEKLEDLLKTMAQEVAFDLRTEGLKARTVQLKFRYPDFSTFTRARTLPEPTFLAAEISRTAIELLRAHKDPENPLRLIGVSVRNFVEKENWTLPQLDLFGGHVKVEKDEKVEMLRDQLRRKFGKSVLK